MDLFAPQVKLPMANRLAGLIAYAVATVSAILALLVFPEDVPNVSGLDTGHGFGYWAGLIVILAGLVLSLMRLQQTGGKLPGALGNMPNIGARGPQGGMSGGGQPGPGVGGPAGMGNPGGPAAPPPPPPGYGPPPQP
jgi:hypothetical protein